MDTPDHPASRSPRRELQGPRPTPLKVRKDSHKIRKPPVPPQQALHPQAPPPRPPVIIYTISPKIIHANPNEFMSLVQRLTGPTGSNNPSCSSTSSSGFHQDHNNYNAAISPAARFAAIEKTKPQEFRRSQEIFDMEMLQGININTEIENTRQFQGILSPNPASLQPINPQNFFSPSSDPNPLSFLYDLSPILHSNRNYLDSSLIPSPSYFISPQMPSPNTLNLLNSLFDI